MASDTPSDYTITKKKAKLFLKNRHTKLQTVGAAIFSYFVRGLLNKVTADKNWPENGADFNYIQELNKKPLGGPFRMDLEDFIDGNIDRLEVTPDYIVKAGEKATKKTKKKQQNKKSAKKTTKKKGKKKPKTPAKKTCKN
eukprot:440636_1